MPALSFSPNRSHQANRGKLEAEVEQFYADDPGKTRQLFLEAAERLKSIKGSDWFMVRNYDKPPPVLASLLSAVCTLMLVRDSWKSARNLTGSSVQNMEVCMCVCEGGRRGCAPPTCGAD